MVDGKQRLSTIFEFADNEFPVGDHSTMPRLRGKYFKDLNGDIKSNYWKYQFAVEYLDSTEEELINNIFDRINRNVAKLTPQELRHARFSGDFIVQAEELSAWMLENLPKNFPAIGTRSIKQMKDVEITAQLLLLLEEGPKSYSQDDLDKAFSDRDTDWEQRSKVIDKFRATILGLQKIVTSPPGVTLIKTRLRNQADFYSFFGAIHELLDDIDKSDINQVAERISNFIAIVDDEVRRQSDARANRYFDAARSASNDAGPRRTRIDIMKTVILDQPWLQPNRT